MSSKTIGSVVFIKSNCWGKSLALIWRLSLFYMNFLSEDFFCEVWLFILTSAKTQGSKKSEINLKIIQSYEFHLSNLNLLGFRKLHITNFKPWLFADDMVSNNTLFVEDAYRMDAYGWKPYGCNFAKNNSWLTDYSLMLLFYTPWKH